MLFPPAFSSPLINEDLPGQAATFYNRFSSTGCMGSTTVCPVQNFPPPSELLVCQQPHRQKVVPGQNSLYEMFLATSHTGRKSCRVKSLYMKRFCSTLHIEMPKARGSTPDRHLALLSPEERSGGVNITTAMKAAMVQLCF